MHVKSPFSDCLSGTQSMQYPICKTSEPRVLTQKGPFFVRANNIEGPVWGSAEFQNFVADVNQICISVP